VRFDEAGERKAKTSTKTTFITPFFGRSSKEKGGNTLSDEVSSIIYSRFGYAT
jgi:hypothetical protein